MVGLVSSLQDAFLPKELRWVDRVKAAFSKLQHCCCSVFRNSSDSSYVLAICL